MDLHVVRGQSSSQEADSRHGGDAKVEAVREELARMKARDPGAKAIVFSQFTSMLDILHFRLTQASCF